MFRFTFLLICALVPVGLVGARADVANYALPVGASYKNYATATNGKSLEDGSYIATQKFDGEPMTVDNANYTSAFIENGNRAQREKRAGYLTMDSWAILTTLRVPLGWFAFDNYSEKEDFNQAVIVSADKKVRIEVRLQEYDERALRQGTEATQLQLAASDATHAHLRAMGFEAESLEVASASGESLAVRAPKITGAGTNFSYLEYYGVRSTPAERKAQMGAFGPDDYLLREQLPLIFSLRAPVESFDKYLPLLGLIARDEGLLWIIERHISLKQALEVSPLTQLAITAANQTVTRLKAGDIAAYVDGQMADELKSSSFVEMIQQMSASDAAELLALKRKDFERSARTRLVPFLKNLPPTTTTMVTLVYNRDPQYKQFSVELERQAKIGQRHLGYEVLISRERGVPLDKPAKMSVEVTPNLKIDKR